MKLINIATKKPYEMSKEKFEKLGRHKKLFKVIDPTDGPEVKEIVIENTITKPDTGSAKDNKATGANTNKARKK